MAIEPGDVVVLKSGGQPMTVATVDENSVECLWLGEEGELFRETIPSVALSVVADTARRRTGRRGRRRGRGARGGGARRRRCGRREVVQEETPDRLNNAPFAGTKLQAGVSAETATISSAKVSACTIASRATSGSARAATFSIWSLACEYPLGHVNKGVTIDMRKSGVIMRCRAFANRPAYANELAMVGAGGARARIERAGIRGPVGSAYERIDEHDHAAADDHCIKHRGVKMHGQASDQRLEQGKRRETPRRR